MLGCFATAFFAAPGAVFNVDAGVVLRLEWRPRHWAINAPLFVGGGKSFGISGSCSRLGGSSALLPFLSTRLIHFGGLFVTKAVALLLHHLRFLQVVPCYSCLAEYSLAPSP